MVSYFKKGCGKHIDEALRDVPMHKRCRCKKWTNKQTR